MASFKAVSKFQGTPFSLGPWLWAENSQLGQLIIIILFFFQGGKHKMCSSLLAVLQHSFPPAAPCLPLVPSPTALSEALSVPHC